MFHFCFTTNISNLAHLYIWHVNSADLDDFVTGIGNITSEEDYRNIMWHFGIRSSHKEFWSHSDKIHVTLDDMEPIEGGILGYNRLENR